MMKNLKLKATIVFSCKSQREIAREAGINETVVSKAVCGRYVMTKDEKQKIADVLGRKPYELFE